MQTQRVLIRKELIRQRIIQRSPHNPKWKRLQLACSDTFREYTKKTKVSGMWLLRPGRTHGASRWIWSTVLLSLLLLGIYLSLQLWMKFYSYPILNTVSADLAITDVAFPGVTICSLKVVNTKRIDKYVKTLKIPDGYKLADVMAGFEYINSFTDRNWLATSITGPYNVTDAVLRYNNVSIYEAALQVSAGCDDFVQRCFWGIKEFPCQQEHQYLSFKMTTTYLGPCCSFNYNPRNSSYVPFATNTFGLDGGLTFIGAEVSGTRHNHVTGLTVLTHHPKDFVIEATSSVTITTNSESFIEISPTVQTSSTEVLELDEGKRDCLISNDLDIYSYRQAACMLACQKEAIYKKCHCHPYNLASKDTMGHRECKLNDTGCYSRNFESFKNVKCSRCLPNCYDVTYTTLAHQTDLSLHNYSISTLYTQTNLTEDSFIVRVFMTRQVVPSIRKVTVMSWIGLLSDLGGVFNLCLGLSMISLVELFYYCTYRLYANYKRRSVLMQPYALK